MKYLREIIQSDSFILYKKDSQIQPAFTPKFESHRGIELFGYQKRVFYQFMLDLFCRLHYYSLIFLNLCSVEMNIGCLYSPICTNMTNLGVSQCATFQIILPCWELITMHSVILENSTMINWGKGHSKILAVTGRTHFLLSFGNWHK